MRRITAVRTLFALLLLVTMTACGQAEDVGGGGASVESSPTSTIATAMPEVATVVQMGTVAPTSMPPVSTSSAMTGTATGAAWGTAAGNQPPVFGDDSLVHDDLADSILGGGAKCMVSSGSIEGVTDLRTLAWASTYIVIGEVVKWHPSVPLADHPQQPAYTLYEVDVLSVVRGNDVKRLTLVASGGEIEDGCTNPPDWSPAPEGSRMVLFLQPLHDAYGRVAYVPVGETQGRWAISDDRVDVNNAHQFAGTRDLSVREAIAQIVAAIDAGKPAHWSYTSAEPVSLEQAPLHRDVDVP